jgi:hypothetical protein
MWKRRLFARVYAGVLVLTVVLAGCASENPESPSTTMSEQDWRTHIVQVPLPKTGCFTATYPSLQWREVACVPPPPPDVHFAPARGGPGPANVGSTSLDYAALRPPTSTSFINAATGSFPSVTGVKTETDSLSGQADYYTLQLNTNHFFTKTSVSPLCPTAAPPTPCWGMQQFIFENSNGKVFMEYFLSIPGATSCPSGGWTQVAPLFVGYTSCTVFSPMAVYVGSQPIANLQALSLTGTATAGGLDTVYLGMGGTMKAVNTDSILNLGATSTTTADYGWRIAEFNVFGACCGSTANFNANSTIVVKTTIHYGETAAPVCWKSSYTAETNNLTLVGAPTLGTQPSPAIEFTESNKAGGTPASCAAADGYGDTHLRTFSGLLYDFQATGDFLLAQAQDFAVQTRQVSGAPTWPNASLNQAVATQMGTTRVALCAAAPAPLVVDGKPAELADGHTLALPSGVDVSRTSNVYLVSDHSGNSLRAVMNGTAAAPWIDVSVGLGTWPTKVRGLLANADGNVHALAASDGTVFNTPVSFADLYGRYGESWRVAPADSLLAACGGAAKENGIPSQPFFARDLDAQAPNSYARARAICTDAGVKVLALLDACTLDVAVLGTEKAAAAYVGAPAPAAVGVIGQAG